MQPIHPWYRWDNNQLILKLLVQPRANRDEIAGPRGAHLRVRITAPPVEGKANQHLCNYLAKLCGVAKKAVELTAGHASRYKRVRITAPKRLPPHIERDT